MAEQQQRKPIIIDAQDARSKQLHEALGRINQNLKRIEKLLKEGSTT